MLAHPKVGGNFPYRKFTVPDADLENHNKFMEQIQKYGYKSTPAFGFDRLAKILIEKESFFDKGKYTLKKDRNKMSIVGLSFYLCVIFIVALTLFFCLLPKIPCEPFEFDATKMYLYADTLNQKRPIILSIILLCSEFVYFAVSLFQYIT